jgi:hypothetical protein
MSYRRWGCEVVVAVGAEVDEVRAGVGERMPTDGEGGVADGSQGAFLARRLTIRSRSA